MQLLIYHVYIVCGYVVQITRVKVSCCMAHDTVRIKVIFVFFPITISKNAKIFLQFKNLNLNLTPRSSIKHHSHPGGLPIHNVCFFPNFSQLHSYLEWICESAVTLYSKTIHVIAQQVSWVNGVNDSAGSHHHSFSACHSYIITERNATCKIRWAFRF